MVVLKAQINNKENKYYPFNDIAIPMGYFCGSYDKTLKIAKDNKSKKIMTILQSNKGFLQKIRLMQ